MRVADVDLDRMEALFAGWDAGLDGVSLADLVADLRDLRAENEALEAARNDWAYRLGYAYRDLMRVRATKRTLPFFRMAGEAIEKSGGRCRTVPPRR